MDVKTHNLTYNNTPGFNITCVSFGVFGLEKMYTAPSDKVI